MTMQELKKEFTLKAIAPYFKNPSICGYNAEEDKCRYFTEDGRKCVLGQFLMKPEDYKDVGISAAFLLLTEGEGILIESARGILTNKEWGRLQLLHDALANDPNTVDYSIKRLNLFTKQELIDYSSTL